MVEGLPLPLGAALSGYAELRHVEHQRAAASVVAQPLAFEENLTPRATSEDDDVDQTPIVDHSGVNDGLRNFDGKTVEDYRAWEAEIQPIRDAGWKALKDEQLARGRRQEAAEEAEEAARQVGAAHLVADGSPPQSAGGDAQKQVAAPTQEAKTVGFTLAKGPCLASAEVPRSTPVDRVRVVEGEGQDDLRLPPRTEGKLKRCLGVAISTGVPG